MMIRSKILSLLVFLHVPLFLFGEKPSAIDLAKMSQDFVLETKQIQIPGYPDAFNPSIVRWGKSVLLCFRIRDPLTSSTDGVGFIWLNRNYDPVGDPVVLKVLHAPELQKSWIQDPRLFTIGSHLFIVYSNLVDEYASSGEQLRRMYIARIVDTQNHFFALQPEPFLSFDCQERMLKEKNWFPFSYNNQMMLGYSIAPLNILQPIFGTGHCQTVSTTQADIHWNWGELRGGTPAMINGNEYLAFFHSSKDLSSVQSNGKKMTHYFFGAFTFTRQPPFAITQISPEPIIGPDFYVGPQYETWKPLRVVFPGGYIFDGDCIWVAYGKQDHEAWMVKLDLNGLLQSLIPVSLDQ